MSYGQGSACVCGCLLVCSLRACCLHWQAAWRLRVRDSGVDVQSIAGWAGKSVHLRAPPHAWPPAFQALSLKRPLHPAGMPHAATLCCICGGDVDAAVRQWGKAAVGKDGAAPSVDALEVSSGAFIHASIEANSEGRATFRLKQATIVHVAAWHGRCTLAQCLITAATYPAWRMRSAQ